MQEKTARQVYEELSARGDYKIVDANYDVIKKIKDMAVEEISYADYLTRQKVVNWRIIYTIYYEALRKICEALIQLDGIKISNHQGCFAYVCLNFPELSLNWNFFEKIRTTRNRSVYEGKNILHQDWEKVETQIKHYFYKIRKLLEKN